MLLDFNIHCTMTLFTGYQNEEKYVLQQKYTLKRTSQTLYLSLKNITQFLRIVSGGEDFSPRTADLRRTTVYPKHPTQTWGTDDFTDDLITNHGVDQLQYLLPVIGRDLPNLFELGGPFRIELRVIIKVVTHQLQFPIYL